MNALQSQNSEPARQPTLSVVLPVYNEEDNVEPIYEEIREALEGMDFEILFVDDGSSDSSQARLRKLQESDPRVRIVVFRRNFGQTAAMAAGLDLARGRVIATLDADRQNDPRDIPAMLERLEQGYDMVCGWR
ncbi:MAG: glycosyltransferase, partial [Proteobacteria bacterium]